MTVEQVRHATEIVFIAFYVGLAIGFILGKCTK